MEQRQQEMAITQMRKSAEMLGISSTESYGDPTMMRFLIARSMKPEKAAKMFVDWKKWRDEFVPLGSIPDSEVEDELAANKVYLQGLSRNGQHPVLIAIANKHFASNDHVQFKKFVVHILDKTIASSFKEGNEIGNEKLIVLADLENISYKNLDVRAFVATFQCLQAYYPERLAKVFMLNVPWIFLSFWNIVSRFLDKATLEKIVFVSNGEERRDCIMEIGEETLAKEYGGRAKLVAAQDVTVTAVPTK